MGETDPLQKDLNLLAQHGVIHDLVKGPTIECAQLADMLEWCFAGFERHQVEVGPFVRLEARGVACYGTPIRWRHNYFLEDRYEQSEARDAMLRLGIAEGAEKPA